MTIDPLRRSSKDTASSINIAGVGMHHTHVIISKIATLESGTGLFAYLFATDELVIRAQVAEPAVVEAFARKGTKSDGRHERQGIEQHKQTRSCCAL